MKKCIFIALAAGFALAAKAQTIELFNGRDLKGWGFVVEGDAVPADKVYSVVDGVINIAGAPKGYMYTEEEYGDYILNVEWRWGEGASNSGIFLLIQEILNPFPNGIECQLAAGKAGDLVMLRGAKLAEHVPDPNWPANRSPFIPKRNPSSEKPAGEWNRAEISVKDGVINVYINGVHQNTATNPVKKGRIGLQSEGKTVQFRNIKLTKW